MVQAGIMATANNKVVAITGRLILNKSISGVYFNICDPITQNGVLVQVMSDTSLLFPALVLRSRNCFGVRYIKD